MAKRVRMKAWLYVGSRPSNIWRDLMGVFDLRKSPGSDEPDYWVRVLVTEIAPKRAKKKSKKK